MKLAFTGGGTLGHVLPALAVWDAVRALDSSAEAFYIGGRGERERKAVEDRGLRCFSISTGKLRRYFSLRNFTDIFRIVAGFFQTLSILRRERPDVLFSKGGYVSVPVVLAARFLGIRTVSHESDLSLGLANRINARFSDIVCLGFDSSLVDGRKYIHTGNPLRPDIRRLVGLKGEEEEGLILVLGGSMRPPVRARRRPGARPSRLREVRVHRQPAAGSHEPGPARRQPCRCRCHWGDRGPWQGQPPHTACQREPRRPGRERGLDGGEGSRRGPP